MSQVRAQTRRTLRTQAKIMMSSTCRKGPTRADGAVAIDSATRWVLGWVVAATVLRSGRREKGGAQN